MLLILSLLSVILCTSGEESGKVALYSSPELVVEMRKYAETCGKEYAVEPSALRQLLSWSFPRDEPHLQFVRCVVMGAGYLTEDNHLNRPKLLRMVPLNGTVDDYKNTLENCDKISRDNPLDTVYEMGACIIERYQITITKPKAA